MKQSIFNVTLYELMAEDFNVWLGKNSSYGYDLHLEGYDKDSPGIEEKQIAPAAVDSFAKICRLFLKHYDKINRSI